ncbi:MAG: RHS repeat-associated core domain-containing protein [Thermoguttaceae bacterium]
MSETWQELETAQEPGAFAPGVNLSLHRYIWGVRYIDDLVLRESGDERLYSLADANWNVVAVCDNTAEVMERYNYDAFGRTIVLAPDFSERNESAYNWNRTFIGQVLDSETGLMLYRNRYYSPTLGRFISRDPIGYRSVNSHEDVDFYDDEEHVLQIENVNLYGYLRNNSTTLLDPSGLQKQCNDFTNATCIAACGEVFAKNNSFQKMCEMVCKTTTSKTCKGLFEYCLHLHRHRQKKAGEACQAVHLMLCPNANGAF